MAEQDCVKTDIPLKRLTALCGADLLPLLGAPDATLIEVVSQELPATARRLDTVLRIRSPQGQVYLQVIEWQAYPDPAVLWRLAWYMAWLGQQEPTTPILGTVIYLSSDSDAGDTLDRTIDGLPHQIWQFQCIRLWELDAVAAVATQVAGLAVLSPLMRNASAELVEVAI